MRTFMSLNKNSIHTIEISDITNLGFGVGKLGGEVVFVGGAVPGDKIRARIIKTASSFAVGRVEEFIERSSKRTNSRCNNKQCAACAYKCLDYSAELDLKQAWVRSAFKKAGLSDIEISAVTPSPSCRSYRNKAQYPIALSKTGEYIIGFYAPKSHRVTEAADCPLAPDVFREIICRLRSFFKKHELSVYDSESGKGLLRHIYLRRGEVSGEILLTLVINGSVLPHADELVSSLIEKLPQLVGILLNKNTDDTNVILGKEYKTLYGRDHIIDTLAGVTLKITAPSFYQVNHDCAEFLYAKARALAAPEKSDTVLDLYCGAGSIGLSMASAAKEIIGIEIVESAVACAKENAQMNNIENASFYLGDAADAEALLAGAEKSRGERIIPDIVILDPPRGGSDERLLSHIASLSPKKILYISCNPTTLARDIAFLRREGYTTGVVYPVDMFPATGHVETVVLLSREKVDDYVHITVHTKDLKR